MCHNSCSKGIFQLVRNQTGFSGTITSLFTLLPHLKAKSHYGPHSQMFPDFSCKFALKNEQEKRLQNRPCTNSCTLLKHVNISVNSHCSQVYVSVPGKSSYMQYNKSRNAWCLPVEDDVTSLFWLHINIIKSLLNF